MDVVLLVAVPPKLAQLVPSLGNLVIDPVVCSLQARRNEVRAHLRNRQLHSKLEQFFVVHFSAPSVVVGVEAAAAEGSSLGNTR